MALRHDYWRKITNRTENVALLITVGLCAVALVETSNIALNLIGQLHIACVMPRFYSLFYERSEI